jgi:5-methylcytosine-specific restriction enzyme A
MHTLGKRVATLDTRTALPPDKCAEPFYLSQAWRVFVRGLIEERFGGAALGHCEDRACRHPQRQGIRLFGDHIHELKDGGAPLEGANILFRCGACHTRKSNEARAARTRERPTPKQPDQKHPP